jgi:hypothetical protein
VTIRLDAFQDFTDPNKLGYGRENDVEFDDGTDITRYMPGFVGGKRMRATVIPHARMGGGSRAYDPHNPPHRRVHIDPHLEGQSVVIDLAQITPDLAQEATDLGQEFADQHADKVAGIEALRLRGSAAFHLIGAKQRADAAATPRAPQAPTTAPVAPRAPSQVPQSPMARPAARPIKAATFDVPRDPPTVIDTSRPPPAASGGLLGRFQQPAPAVSQGTQAVPAVGPPTKKVTFGVPGFGLHEAYYHDVLVEGQAFTLVYDERFQGGSKYLPNQIEGSFAARIAGDTVDYKLHWPDISISDPTTRRTYSVLFIEATESNQND